MRRILRHSLPLVTITLVVLSAAGCASDDTAPTTSPGTDPAPVTTATATTGSFSGDLSGTMSLGLCTASIGSLRVSVKGDSAVYLGSVSGQSMGFIGPGGGTFALATTGKKPVVSPDGTIFDVDGVVLTDKTITKKTITLKGTLHCPA